MTMMKELLQFHETLCGEARQLVVERGDEYAAGADTLRVFRTAGELAIESPSKIAFIMMCIKVARLENQMLKSNRIYDTVRDLINYTVYMTNLYKKEQGH